MGEIIVFGFLDVIELEPDEFTIQYAKNIIDCPRCKRFIEKAEKLLADGLFLKKQDIAGICDHCRKQLAKIQKLVRLTKGKEDIAAAAEAGALKTHIEQEKRLYEREVKEPKGLTERAPTQGTLAPQTHISEDKAKDEKLLGREESPGAEERIVKARGEKLTAQEESQRAADKKLKGRDEKLIARVESQREKDTKLIAGAESLSEKGEITSKQARGKKPMAQEESLGTTDKKSKTRDEQMKTQGESLRVKDNKSMPKEESPSAKDKRSKTRGEKPIAQEEPQSTRDQKSKARGEKPIAQEEPSSTRDKKSKVSDAKTKSQGEQLKDKDKKLPAREESPTAKDKSKARDENPITKDKLLNAKENKIKTKDLNKFTQEQLLTAKENKSKAGDEQPIAKDESLIAKDKKVKAKNEKSIAQEDEQKAKDNKSKSRDEAKEKMLKAKEEKLEGKENTLKAKEEKPPRQPNSAEQMKALIADEKLRKEKEKLEADNRKKQQQEEKQLLEIAEKKAKQAALELAKEAAKFQPPKLALTVSESDDGPEFKHDVYKAPVRSDIIIGETICKHKIRQTDTDKDLDTIDKVPIKKFRKEKAPDVTSERHGLQPVERLESSKKGKITQSESPAKVPVVGSEKPKKGVVESEKTEKVLGVKVTEKLEKATKKSIQDSEAANNKEDGKIRYALSDPTFIEKGWTKLPLEKVVRKMNVYRMRPSKPEFDWFEHHKNRVLEYDTGERLAEVDDSGRGRWYYRSGALAMDYYDAEETNAGQRFVVYSSGAPDARGRPRPRTVLATFDRAGNGIVFDHAGKTRLKYNQTEGVVLDREIGPVSRWKWHTLNDPPVLQQVMLDTQLGHKDPDIARLGPAETPRPPDDAMLSIERDNFVKEKAKKSSQKFKPFQIKMKALKINENFSLRVLDQASVYLLYRDGSTNLKINIGMLLDHQEIVDTDAADIGVVANKMDTLPAATGSVAALQAAAARARRRARLAARPEGQLSDVGSVDAMRAAASRPWPPPLATCGVPRPRPPPLATCGVPRPRPPPLATCGVPRPRPPPPATCGVPRPRPPPLATCGVPRPRPPPLATCGVPRPRPPPPATCGARATHGPHTLLQPCSCDLYCKPLF